MALGFLQRILAAGHAIMPGTNNVPALVPPLQEFTDWPVLYQMLFDYYKNEGLYDELASELRKTGLWKAPIKGIRNPARRMVEFYAHHVWQGPDLDTALPLEDTSEPLKKAIHQIWDWSNWQVKRQQHIRWLSIFGDTFIKVAQVNKRIIMQQIDPRLVTEIRADERDFLTYIRLDDHRLRTRSDGSSEPYTRTEIWDKSTQMMRIWEYSSGHQYDLSNLSPIEEHSFSEFAIDFIPFVWTKFQDIGEERGIGCFTLALDKIDELNQAATRLHQILFRYNRPTLAISSSGSDLAGRPLPPMSLNGRAITGAPDSTYMGEDDILQMPSGASVQQLVPNIDFGASLAVVKDMLSEIETDSPELLYYRLKDMNDASGRAVRFFLGPAIKTVEEVRANAEAGLIRAHQMAITIGMASGLLPKNLGSFDNGKLDHHFKAREVIALSEIDEAQIAQDMGQAATYWQQVRVKPESILERLGFDPKKDLAPEPTPVLNPVMPTNTPQKPGVPADGQQQPPTDQQKKSPPANAQQ